MPTTWDEGVAEQVTYPATVGLLFGGHELVSRWPAERGAELAPAAGIAAVVKPTIIATAAEPAKVFLSERTIDVPSVVTYKVNPYGGALSPVRN